MKIYYLFLSVSFLAACSSSNNYEKHFSGNKFKMELVVDTTSPEYQLMKGMLASMDIQMDFKTDGKMTYSATMGAATAPEQVFDWKVRNDSLFTTNPEGLSDGYKISKVEGDQIFLAVDSLSFILKKIP